MDNINVFILAAGLGERLRPITNHIPKPLLPILGKPLLQVILDRISSLPVNKIGINIHYKWEIIKDWVQSSSYSKKIRLFLENPILGTGGAIKNAESILNESVFLVHNSDILSDLSLQTLVEKHLSSGNLITLAVHDDKEFNTVWIDMKGELKFIGKASHKILNELRQVAFTGIAVYSPEFMNFLPEGNSNVVDAWLKAVSSGFSVGTVDFTGCTWTDIGTPEAYSSVIFNKLKENGENLCIHPSVDCRRVEIDGYTVIEKGSIIEGIANFRNCILLPDSKIPDHSNLENSIVGPDYIINIEEPLKISQIMLNNLKQAFLSTPALALFFKGIEEITLIGTGGSDRKYYRIRDQGKTAVLMECSMNDTDYHRHITYTKFFRKYSVPVPELFGADTEKMLALFEDLGDLSLYSWLTCRNDNEQIKNMYRNVLDIIVNLHTKVTFNISECNLLGSRIFDYEHLRWETDYFTERFVCGLIGADIKDQKRLDEEFEGLAKKVDSFRKSVIHRDFQSKNIMITKGNIPRILDYQGARIGPPAYDIASILWDPYFRLDEKMRVQLLDYYIEKMKDSHDNNFDEADFLNTILPCRLQRHMQALGAYGFLAKVKGKSYFLKYVPQAFQYLKEETETVKKEYPVLYGVVQNLQEKIRY